MQHKILAIVLLSGCAMAQNPMGTFRNTGTTYATRGGNGVANSNPAVLWTRFDKECYAGMGNGTTPGMSEIVGLQFVIQDQDLATQDAFSLVCYTENPAQPSYPDVATPIATSGNITLPLGTGGGAWRFTSNFATPIQAPSNADLFLGLSTAAGWTMVGTPVQITDGLSVWEIRAAVTTLQTGQSIDVAGAGLPATPADEGRFSGYYVPNPATGPGMPVVTMFKITPVLPNSGGVATAVTNQTSHVPSTVGAALAFDTENPGAGTACMLSGLYPDAANPAVTPGRADDLGQLYIRAGMTNGLVFFLVDLGTFGMEIPMSSFVPGSTGVTCLNFGSVMTLGFAPVTNGAAFQVTTLPLYARQMVQGFSWLTQSIALDIPTNTLHAAPCTRQLL